MTSNFVLLPGLDGTGELFADFIEALPQATTVRVARYPTQKHLNYAELLTLVKELTADLGEYVVVAESFSAPLAIRFAGAHPPNLTALVICAGFASSPFPFLGSVLEVFVHPWLFRFRLPDSVLDHYMVSSSAPSDLKAKIRQTLGHVSPQVLAGRVREVLNCDVRKDLPPINVPILYLRGTNDLLVKGKCLENIQRLHPSVQLASIPAPHLVPQCQPCQSAKIITEFCSSIAE
jgi:pimeloyl-ACP methyl ester carboxylesterase